MMQQITTTPAGTLPKAQRIVSIDMLRGAVMIIMALDHCRDFFHIQAMTDQPTNMATTTVSLFFTRWITHFCAPVFLFLTGLSAFLYGSNKTKREVSFFLFTRGCWLLVLEVIVLSLLFTFNPKYPTIFLQVIWASGISMIILSLLVYLPWRLVLVIGICIFAGHNLLDAPEAARMGNINLFWGFIHGRNVVLPLNKDHVVLVAYSFLPWTGLMILGYCLGRLFEPTFTAQVRRRFLFITGLVLIVAFIALRLVNHYGDPFPWTVQHRRITTVLSFFNVNKYPPSLIFCCMTIGPALIILALTEHLRGRLSRLLLVYGKVPLFYFLVHFFLIHLICVVIFFLKGYPASKIYESSFGFRPINMGFHLPVVYLLWFLVLCIMYPLCKMYGKYKSTHRRWWLPYL